MEDIQALIDDGSINVCPCCGEMSAHAWQDTNAYEEFDDGIIPGGFIPEPGTIAHIRSSSAFEWQCGHCGRHLMPEDSPINCECYTH